MDDEEYALQELVDALMMTGISVDELTTAVEPAPSKLPEHNADNAHLPGEWCGIDFRPKATRGAFADWLEERGYWQAAEVRRVWWRPTTEEERGGTLSSYAIGYGALIQGKAIHDNDLIDDSDQSPDPYAHCSVRRVLRELINSFFAPDAAAPDTWQ